MFNFIPEENYSSIHYNVQLFFVLITVFHTYTKNFNSSSNLTFMKSMAVVLLLWIILYLGLRPISGYFGDMGNYSRMFIKYQHGASIRSTKDPFFYAFVKASGTIMTVKTYFLLCAALYIVPLFLVCKKWFARYHYYAFLLLVISFSFWPYGTNGIRNGIASSLFLLGISRDKRIFQLSWLLLAMGFHLSMILPSLGWGLAQIYNKPKKMLLFWILCIPLSLIGGGVWESYFGNLGFGDERISYLTTKANIDEFRSIGFRWDFLLYSATAIFAGWYYIVKKKYNDKIYFVLFNTYCFTNAFWILVIRANFSNRFAYLSWFMMALVIIYPLLKTKMVIFQHKKIGLITLLYFTFTYFMTMVLGR